MNGSVSRAELERSASQTTHRKLSVMSSTRNYQTLELVFVKAMSVAR